MRHSGFLEKMEEDDPILVMDTMVLKPHEQPPQTSTSHLGDHPMRQFTIAAIIATFMLLAAFSNTPAPAGEGAIVLAHGGIVANVWIDGTHCRGPATLVWTPNGKVRGQANMHITAGTPVSKVTRATMDFFIDLEEYPVADAVGEIILTPSGNANVRFSN